MFGPRKTSELSAEDYGKVATFRRPANDRGVGPLVHGILTGVSSSVRPNGMAGFTITVSDDQGALPSDYGPLSGSFMVELEPRPAPKEQRPGYMGSMRPKDGLPDHVSEILARFAGGPLDGQERVMSRFGWVGAFSFRDPNDLSVVYQYVDVGMPRPDREGTYRVRMSLR